MAKAKPPQAAANEEWTAADQREFLASKAGRRVAAVLRLRRQLALDQMVFACMPAGPLNIRGANGQSQQVKPTASELREQSVAYGGQAAEIDSLWGELFHDPEKQENAQ